MCVCADGRTDGQTVGREHAGVYSEKKHPLSSSSHPTNKRNRSEPQPRHTQVEGKDGFKVLAGKVKAHGPGVLYHGALAGAFFILIKRHPPSFTDST